MAKTFHGFEDYVAGRGITPSFLEDFDKLSLKIYSRWQLGTLTYEDFLGFAREKLLNRIHNFNPELGNIGTFVFTLILNEAKRLHSKMVREVDADHQDPVFLTVESQTSITDQLVSDVISFMRHAYSLGVYVDPICLVLDYTNHNFTPTNQAFCWWLSGRQVESE